MSLLAGVFSLQPRRPVPRDWGDTLASGMSRRLPADVTLVRDEAAVLAKLNVGAYDTPGLVRDDAGRVTMITGDPLCGDHSRQIDAERLHAASARRDWEILSTARGDFSAAFYDPAAPGGPALTLVADRLAVRPVYYAAHDGYFFFASALRILEGLPFLATRLDVRGLLEQIAFGYPLADRTPYSNVRTIRSAECITVTTRETTSAVYWRWDSVRQVDASRQECVERVTNAFRDAVGRRLRSDRTPAAFLSGGMDSRALVCELLARDARVHTINASTPGTQDRAFAQAFAERAGTMHLTVPHRIDVSLLENVAARWDDSAERRAAPPEHPALFWSGDGGSVGLGFVYMTPRIVSLMRQHRVDEAIHEFRSDRALHVSRRVLRHPLDTHADELLTLGVREEIERLTCPDPGRSFFLFLLLNDQRRHLASHFERIDLSKIDLHLPFFDAVFLESVLATPLDWSLGHELYMGFVDHAYPSFRLAPWQTYPGHVPCPLPADPALAHQWSAKSGEWLRRWQHAETRRKARALLFSSDFPHPLLRRSIVALAALSHVARVGDMRHIISAAATTGEYWARCGGRYDLPEIPAGAPVGAASPARSTVASHVGS